MFVEKIRDTGEGRHAGEAAVGERRTVEPLGRRLPVEFTVDRWRL